MSNNLHAFNLAMLAKQGWRIISNPHSLIARLYKAVYFPNSNFLNADLGDAPSFSWRSIISARHILQAGLLWKIGVGTQVRIWEDNWIPNPPILSLQRPVGSSFNFVSELINPATMSWDAQILHTLFSQEVVDSILCIPLSSRRPHDRVTWKLEKRGFFSVKSCYRIARDEVLGNVLSSSSQGDPFSPLWKTLWSAKVPSKVSVCVWRACQNLLPTRAKLISKGYVGDTSCLLCSHPYETVGHVMCECPTAKSIIEGYPFLIQAQASQSCFKEWMLAQAVFLSSENFARLMMFIWSFWKNRNDKLWNNVEKSPQVLISITMSWYEEFLQASHSATVVGNKATGVAKYWSPPPLDVLKLNVDGSFLSSSNFGGVGGVLRGHKGEFIAGFSHRKLAVFSPLHIELLAIKEGIQLLQTMDISQAMIHSDCLIAVQALNSAEEDLSPLGNLIEDIKVLFKELPNISISHASRTTNFVAHRLASFGFDSGSHSEWFSHAPDFILDALLYDCNRM